MMTADLLLHNGTIALLDQADRFVSALAVRQGRIIAVGDEAALAPLRGPKTEIVDLDRRTVIPGIVDSHCHPDSYAIRLLKWQALGPDRIRTKSELLRTIAESARTLPKGRWFIGYRFNEQKSGGYPSIGELDAAGGGRPVLIMRTCGHLALVNSAAIAAAGVAADAEDPPFGRFDRDPLSGAFTGLVRETAAHLFLGQIQDEDSPEDIARGMEDVFAECLSFGITSLYNSLTSSKAIRAYQLMRQRGRLPLRVGIIASGREPGLIDSLIKTGIQSGFGDDWLRLIGVEWCPDCSTSGRTAAYYEPYVGQPALGEPGDNRGMLLYEADDLNAMATTAHKAGLLVCIEGVGDRGIDFALDAIEAALAAHPVEDHRMRVEHCCYVTPPILERMRRLGAVDSSATGFMYDLGDAYIANRGTDAMRHMWPHRTLIDHGIPAPGHSDAAVCQFNPFLAMWSMVNRKTATGQSLDSREAVSRIEALRAYTTLGAWSGREEAIKGSLEPGKVADFAVLDRDYFTVDPDAIREVRVGATYVDGVCRYRA
jgi:predicted amidohydrolase YtcJ